MSSWFSKKKPPQSRESQMKTLAAELEQTVRENTELITQLDDLHEATQRNKSMLDEFINNAASYDSNLDQLRAKMQRLEQEIKTNERKIKHYRNENQQLTEKIAESMSYVKQGNVDPSIQEILDAAESQEEMIFFRDSKGALWEIVKREDVELPELEGEDEEDPDEEETKDEEAI